MADQLSEPEHVARGEAIERTRVAVSREGESGIVAHGQRRINLIWEITQSVIAIAVTSTTLYVAADRVTHGAADSAAFLLLSNAFFLVVGFYFGRTNHQRVGGVGPSQSGR